MWRVADDDNLPWIETDPVLALRSLDGKAHQQSSVRAILPVAADLDVDVLREVEGFEFGYGNGSSVARHHGLGSHRTRQGGDRLLRLRESFASFPHAIPKLAGSVAERRQEGIDLRLRVGDAVQDQGV